MSCLGFGVYLVNGDLSMYISAIYTNLVGNIPVLFILRRSPPSLVPRRACCPMAQAIGVEHRIAFTHSWLLTCAAARVPKFLQMAAAVRAAPPGCRKGELLRWASEYFLSGEKDNDL